MDSTQQKMKFGRYEIVEQVGRGAMGVVYKAHDPQINRIVALKALREDRVTSEDFVQRFLKEAMAIGRLSHPNIVTVYDIGQDHETVYIAMEFLEGTPLNEIIREKKFTPEEIGSIAIQLAESLHYAHSRGIVHRDIKPSNIIVGESGQVKITDFGIAHIEDPSMTQQTQAGQILGTPVYMSPEQVMGQKLDGRSDLYSLGVILYEIALGRRPYTGENLAAVFRSITQDEPPPPCDADPEIPPELSELIMKAMNREIEARFQTGSEMAEAFRGFLRAREAPLPETRVPERSTKFLVPAVAIALVVVLALGAFLLFSPQRTREAPELPKAILKVDSSPVGAQVYIDSAFVGKTPLAVEVPVGKREVRLSLPDFYEWEAQLELNEPEEIPLAVRLVPVE
ncbi:MAG TPA: PEGA domain-containing protein [Deltaproteobacteria bacterium]|nr:PEGA domain-containing protein [Deltaproteobacteria bacterium]